MPDTTVVYYTSNRENPEFERRILETLVENMGDLPLITVSHKPMPLGNNICVGDVGRSGYNAWRQLYLGAGLAKTRFICTAESDYIYPKEYFSYVPPSEDSFYLANPVYLLCASDPSRTRYIPMPVHWREGASVTGRKYLMKSLEDILPGDDIWRSRGESRGMRQNLFAGKKLELFDLPSPAVTFKTSENMHSHVMRYRKTTSRLRGWGRASDLIGIYCG